MSLRNKFISEKNSYVDEIDNNLYEDLCSESNFYNNILNIEDDINMVMIATETHKQENVVIDSYINTLVIKYDLGLESYNNAKMLLDQGNQVLALENILETIGKSLKNLKEKIIEYIVRFIKWVKSFFKPSVKKNEEVIKKAEETFKESKENVVKVEEPNEEKGEKNEETGLKFNQELHDELLKSISKFVASLLHSSLIHQMVFAVGKNDSKPSPGVLATRVLDAHTIKFIDLNSNILNVVQDVIKMSSTTIELLDNQIYEFNQTTKIVGQKAVVNGATKDGSMRVYRQAKEILDKELEARLLKTKKEQKLIITNDTFKILMELNKKISEHCDKLEVRFKELSKKIKKENIKDKEEKAFYLITLEVIKNNTGLMNHFNSIINTIDKMAR